MAGNADTADIAEGDGAEPGELTSGGEVRRFALRLPRTGAAVPGPTPLVLVLHGNLGTEGAGGRAMRRSTTFDREADARGWVVAYPEGRYGNWADGRGVTTADEAGVDDVAFLRALIDHVADRHGTAPDRTVVAGVSNGACMAHRLAQAAGDRVAVLAAVAGTLPEALHAVPARHAVSALLIHGDADPIARLEGGYSRHLGPNGELRGRMISLRETTEYWQAADRCAAETAATTSEAATVRVTVDGGVGGTRVATWTVLGGGHAWPGAPLYPGTAGVAAEFDAAVEICRFAAPLLAGAAERRLG
jgi:polyhydroxybutyrate depolymerase